VESSSDVTKSTTTSEDGPPRSYSNAEPRAYEASLFFFARDAGHRYEIIEQIKQIADKANANFLVKEVKPIAPEVSYTDE